MTSRKVLIHAEVEDDIRDIAAFISLDSPQSAKRFGEEFWQAVVRIAEFPHLGKNLDDIDKTFLSVRVSERFHRHRVFYRLIDESNLEIVRVLHGARDFTAIFRPAP